MLINELLDREDIPSSTWIKDSHVYNYYDEGDNTGYIQATLDGELAGTLYFGRDPDSGKYVGSVEVEPAHQRHGIATNLYDFAEKIVGERFVPDTKQTDDAKAFWRNRISKQYQKGQSGRI